MNVPLCLLSHSYNLGLHHCLKMLVNTTSMNNLTDGCLLFFIQKIAKVGVEKTSPVAGWLTDDSGPHRFC